jgi:hypothetical protein
MVAERLRLIRGVDACSGWPAILAGRHAELLQGGVLLLGASQMYVAEIEIRDSCGSPSVAW